VRLYDEYRGQVPASQGGSGIIHKTTRKLITIATVPINVTFKQQNIDTCYHQFVSNMRNFLRCGRRQIFHSPAFCYFSSNDTKLYSEQNKEISSTYQIWSGGFD
jgi:hypothetical protein